MFKTIELGPPLNKPAPNFMICDHVQVQHQLADLMGNRGLLLGFIGDIWRSASIRRIIWLQRHATTFLHAGVNVALLIQDQPYMLYGFYVSSPTPVEFPLLADEQAEVHQLFNMTLHPGVVFIDQHSIIRYKWLLPNERVWPKIQEILDVIGTL